MDIAYNDMEYKILTTKLSVIENFPQFICINLSILSPRFFKQLHQHLNLNKEDITHFLIIYGKWTLGKIWALVTMVLRESCTL